MKTIINSTLMFVVILLVSSCVSTKKFAEVQKESQKYKEQLSSDELQNNKLQKLNDSLANQVSILKNAVSNQIQEKQQNKARLDKAESLLSELQKAVKIEKAEVTGIRQELCSALKCFTPDELSIKEKDGELYVSMYDELLFPTGSDGLNERGKNALKMLSDVLKNDNMGIMVEGHTDNIPIHNKKFKDNWDLSVARATSVTRILINDKIQPDRIIASGKSKYHPFDANNSEEGRKLNRRTDIVIIPKLQKLYTLIDQENPIN